MRVEERDELLGRLDERSESLVRELQSQSKHLSQINGSLQKHQDNLISNNTTLYGKGDDKGLCGKVRELSGRQWKLILAVAFISTSVGVGGSEIVKVIGS